MAIISHVSVTFKSADVSKNGTEKQVGKRPRVQRQPTPHCSS